MVMRVRRGTTPFSCGTSTVQRWRNRGSPVKTLPLFPNLSCPIPSSLNPLFPMLRHLADWVAPFHRSRNSYSLPLKFLHTPSSPPPLLLPTCTIDRGNHHHSSKNPLHLPLSFSLRARELAHSSSRAHECFHMQQSKYTANYNHEKTFSDSQFH